MCTKPMRVKYCTMDNEPSKCHTSQNESTMGQTQEKDMMNQERD